MINTMITDKEMVLDLHFKILQGKVDHKIADLAMKYYLDRSNLHDWYDAVKKDAAHLEGEKTIEIESLRTLKASLLSA